MNTSLRHSFARCALGLALSAGCSLLAQTAAPAPASGGSAGARTGTSGATGSRTNTGTTTTGTNATGTNTTGTNTTRTNANGTTATGTNATGTTATGTTATRTGANGTNTAGTSNQAGINSNAGAASNPAGTLSSSGMIANFGASDFALQGSTTTSPNATPSNFLFGPGTLFTDASGNTIPRDRFFRRGNQVPATVYYNRSPDGSLVASRVVLNESENTAGATSSVESAGTITEVSPGILVIEQPGASDTPVRYVNNKTTNYVNENGEPVSPESVKAGTPVKIFYTKVGDTLVASRVEVHRNNDGGLPKPAVPGEKSSTRPAKK